MRGDGQQAAELALKALVIDVTGRPAPHPHNLAVLEGLPRAHGMAIPPAVSGAGAGLPERTWTRARYPDPAPNYVPARDITTQGAQQTLSDAETIDAWVQPQLVPPTGTSTGTS